MYVTLGPWQEMPLLSGTGKAEVTAHVQNRWDKLSPGSTFSHTARPLGGKNPVTGRWSHPATSPGTAELQGTRETRTWWSSAWEWPVESKAADLLIFQADLRIAKPSKQETHS